MIIINMLLWLTSMYFFWLLWNKKVINICEEKYEYICMYIIGFCFSGLISCFFILNFYFLVK